MQERDALWTGICILWFEDITFFDALCFESVAPGFAFLLLKKKELTLYHNFK